MSLVSRLLYLKLIYGGAFSKKKRLFFSVIGILIGVSALVVMVSVGEGSKAKVDRQFEEFGINNVVVFPGKAGVRGGRAVVMEMMPTLKLEDASALKNIWGVKRVTPIYDLGSVVVQVGNRKITTRVVGADEAYFAIRKYSIYSGRFFSSKEVARSDLVAVIGWKIKDEVFPDSTPIGDLILISKLPFRIIGVLDKKGTDISGQDLDDVIVVPITVAMRRLDNVDYIKAIEIECESKEVVPLVEKAVDKVLAERHKIIKPEYKDYTIIRAEDIAKQQSQTIGMFSMIIGSVSIISLIVGTFGVMAMMILSVRERYREIGVRKAIGATNRDIMRMFLVEALLITSIGGFLGIILGTAISFGINWMMGNPLILPVKPVIVAFLSMVIFGTMAGLYPAYKASRVDPIESIRS